MNYLRAVTLLLSIIFTSFFSGSALSTSLIKCVHPDGRTEFSDKPCPSASSSSTVSLLPAIGRSQEKTQKILPHKNEIASNRNSQVTTSLSVASNQAMSVFTAWHQALLKNDFVEFKKLQLWVGRGRDALKSEEELKLRFATLVKNVPLTFKMSENKPPTNRTVFLVAIGCKNNIRVGGVASVNKIDGTWKVESNGWEAGWIEAEPVNLPCAYEAGPSSKETKLENKSGILINGQSEFPMLVTPDTSNPAVAAFVAWHTAMIKGDFASYLALSPAVPNITNDLLKQMFDQERLSAPKTIKITVPKLNDRGSFEFTSVGCNGNRPVVGVVFVRKIGETWRVGGSGWGPSWNPKISEVVKCP